MSGKGRSEQKGGENQLEKRQKKLIIFRKRTAGVVTAGGSSGEWGS